MTPTTWQRTARSRSGGNAAALAAARPRGRCKTSSTRPWPDNFPEGETPPYEASSHGQIRSILRTLNDGRTCGGTTLKQRDHNRPKNGPPFYQRVNLSYGSIKAPGRLVHQLVLLAFEGDPPADKPFIRHLDDHPAHNYWAPGGEGNGTNLVYGTEAENIADRMRREAAAQDAIAHWRQCGCAGCGEAARAIEAKVAAQAEIVVIEEETNAAATALSTARVNHQVREAIEATIRKASQPVTAYAPSPRGGWRGRLARYTPWSRQRRHARKRDSDRQDRDA